MGLASSDIELNISDFEIGAFFKDSGAHLEEGEQKLVAKELQIQTAGTNPAVRTNPEVLNIHCVFIAEDHDVFQFIHTEKILRTVKNTI